MFTTYTGSITYRKEKKIKKELTYMFQNNYFKPDYIHYGENDNHNRNVGNIGCSYINCNIWKEMIHNSHHCLKHYEM